MDRQASPWGTPVGAEFGLSEPYSGTHDRALRTPDLGLAGSLPDRHTRAGVNAPDDGAARRGGVDALRRDRNDHA